MGGAGIGGTSSAGDDIDISFSDLIDDLNMAIMGSLQARKDKWTLLADVIYLAVSADQHRQPDKPAGLGQDRCGSQVVDRHSGCRL